tara:strand:+ start:842 stop:2353 length:1512 start_codon:yes stop_codon:yes gene_type:complete
MSISIQKKIISRTVGENDGVSQVFVQNNIPSIFEPIVKPSPFRVPLFGLVGATYQFYEQNINGISVNINNEKTLKYTYTANTSSFSAITKTIYDIYKLEFSIYDKVFNSFNVEGEEITPPTGLTETATGVTFTTETIAATLANPLITLFDTGSTITTPQYELNLPTIVKPEDDFAQSLLEDKSQYFIDTRFEFPLERDKTLGGYQVLSGGVATDITLTGLSESGDFLIETSKNSEVINRGLFSGITVNGALFTYFVAPQKPNIDVEGGEPSVKGDLDTFSPIFSFNNVSDGDYYKLQVTYDVNDVTFTSSTIFDIPYQEGVPDFIRSFSTPLSPDSNFLYRIGNTKEITNIFGVKQSVTTWGRAENAFTATDGIFDVSGTIFQNELIGSPVSGATVTFVVLSTTSDVELGVDAPYENIIEKGVNEPLGGGTGSAFSATTDSNGIYEVLNVKGGALQIIVEKDGYITQVYSREINEDTTGEDLTIRLEWGSDLTIEDVQGQQLI